jgi:cytochrome c
LFTQFPMNKFYLLPAILLLFSCTDKRPVKKILCYAINQEDTWVKELKKSAARQGLQLVITGNRQIFQEDSLRKFSTICLPFSLTDSLNYRNIPAMKRYAESGGGGILAVKDTPHQRKDWPWLHEWMNLPPEEELLQDGGKLYILPATAGGNAMQHALQYLIGDNEWPDYQLSATPAPPDTSRFTYTILDQGLDEPMELCMLPDGNVLFIERKGTVKIYNTGLRKTSTIAHFNVFSGIEDGLLGVAADPGFTNNHRLYFYYAPAGEKWFNKLVSIELHGNTLEMSTEKLILQVPTQRRYCCHSAGYLSFGRDSLLYLSIGDNTNAEETEGYTPVDERPGRHLSDDQASAANSKDLRGKILRIKPGSNGGYSIPDGNLFPKDGSQGYPEIYIMGCRNPYRFHIDMKNNFLYWSDIGPDTKVPSPEGSTISFDEINQARHPGFYGWPYFNGNNQAYPLWDYANKKERPAKDPQHPVNASPNNNGLRNLPPAQPAMIWYSDATSPHFPAVGKGAQTAMAGPVYYNDRYKGAPHKLPDYYNGKLLIYDWVRNWIMAVTMNKEGNYLRMEPFLEHIRFAAPVDMQIAPDGSIYILEYGTNWFAKNADAKLVQITYSEGNRKPVALINCNKLYGAAPLKVNFSAKGSIDHDKNDVLSYTWKFNDKKVEGIQVDHTFTLPGIYKAELIVTDDKGSSNSSMVEIKVGNTPPSVKIVTTANRSFYWDDAVLEYQVAVSDPEDVTIDSNKVQIVFDYLPVGEDLAPALAKGITGNLQYAKGNQLFWSLDCKSCHAERAVSVGPSLAKIADRYLLNKANIAQLASKIITGGSGNWGKRTMSAHPDMPEEDAEEIAKYILSLRAGSGYLPLKGEQTLNRHKGKGTRGAYLLSATYTDKGANNIEPLTGRDHIILLDPRLQAEGFDEGNIFLKTITSMDLTYGQARNNSYIGFHHIYLDGIKSVHYNIQQTGPAGTIEARLDKPDGVLVSKLFIPSGDDKNKWKVIRAAFQQTKGLHNIYFVFKNAEEKNRPLFNIDWLYFSDK